MLEETIINTHVSTPCFELSFKEYKQTASKRNKTENWEDCWRNQQNNNRRPKSCTHQIDTTSTFPTEKAEEETNNLIQNIGTTQTWRNEKRSIKTNGNKDLTYQDVVPSWHKISLGETMNTVGTGTVILSMFTSIGWCFADLQGRWDGFQVLQLRYGSDVLRMCAMFRKQRLRCQGPPIPDIQSRRWRMLWLRR